MWSSANPLHGRVLLLIVLLAICSHSNSGYSQPNAEFDERVFLKLRAKNDFVDIGRYESEFFKTLLKLVESQKLKPRDYLFYRSDRSRSVEDALLLTDGYAVAINAKQRRFVVVILASSYTDVQQLLLLDERGKILDKSACAVNGRYGRVETEMPKKQEADGAQLIIRFVPRRKDEPCHYWHKVTYQDRAYSFRAEEDESQPTEWATKGLCRIAIRDSKFAVVFPKLGKSDAEVLKEMTGK